MHAPAPTSTRGPCPVCRSDRWLHFLTTTTGRIMLGDQRVIPGRLDKVQCAQCGTVANARPFTSSELAQLYANDYELNTHRREEHQFYTDDGPLPRSELYLRRIAPHVRPECDSLLEVGCGCGNLLARLAEHLPDTQIRGIDGSAQAVALGRERGLNMIQGLVTDSTTLPPSDTIICLNVVEHVEDPIAFLRTLRRTLRPGGRLILSLPLQENPSHDIFFHEHVWHFEQAHIIRLLANAGLQVVVCEPTCPPDELIGLFVCAPVPGGVEQPEPHPGGACAANNRDAWSGAFAEVDAWLLAREPQRVVTVGSAEIFSLFWAFTNLPEFDVAACLDDDPNKVGTQRHGVNVVPPAWLLDHPSDAVVVTLSPRYHGRVQQRLCAYVHPADILTWNVTPNTRQTAPAC